MTGLGTLPETAPLRALGGGGGAGPTDPAQLAARTLRAATGDDKDTALKLYDYGLENYGQAFVQSYNALRDQHELTAAGPPPQGVLQRVQGALQQGQGAAPPMPDELPYKDGGLRSAVDPVQGPSTVPPPNIPMGIDNIVANTQREAEGAGREYQADQAAAAAAAKGKVLDAATLDAQALIKENGYSPDAAIAEALKQPGVADNVSIDELRSRLGLPPSDKTLPAAPPLDRPPSPTTLANTEPLPTEATPGPATSGVPGAVPPPTGGGLATVTVPASETPPSGNGVVYADVPGGGSDLVIRTDPGMNIGERVPKGTRRGGGIRSVDSPPIVAGTDAGGLTSTVTPAPAPGPTQAGPVPDVNVSAVPPPQPAVEAAPSPTAAPGAPPAPAAAPARAGAGDFMGDPNIWSFLTSAGLGMMSSQSPTALGAIGAGGLQGLSQLDTLRKAQRERLKNEADARFQDQRIALGYEGEKNANTRHAAGIKSSETINDRNNAAAERRLGISESGATTRLGISESGQTSRQQTGIEAEQSNIVLRGKVADELAAKNAQREIDGKSLTREEAYNFARSKGANHNDALLLSNGFNPQSGSGSSSLAAWDYNDANKLGESVIGSFKVDLEDKRAVQEFKDLVGPGFDQILKDASHIAQRTKNWEDARNEVNRRLGLPFGTTFIPGGAMFGSPRFETPDGQTIKPRAAAPPAGGGGTSSPQPVYTYVPDKGLVKP